MDNANSIAMIIYKAFMLMYLSYNLHVVITKHLIITVITQEKLPKKTCTGRGLKKRKVYEVNISG